MQQIVRRLFWYYSNCFAAAPEWKYTNQYQLQLIIYMPDSQEKQWNVSNCRKQIDFLCNKLFCCHTGIKARRAWSEYKSTFMCLKLSIENKWCHFSLCQGLLFRFFSLLLYTFYSTDNVIMVGCLTWSTRRNDGKIWGGGVKRRENDNVSFIAGLQSFVIENKMWFSHYILPCLQWHLTGVILIITNFNYWLS